MCVGQNTYQLTLGTLGGYVSVYDIRYSLVASQFRHHLNNPVLSLAQMFRPSRAVGSKTWYGQTQSQPGYALVSTGCSHYELSQINLENGKVECCIRSGAPAEVPSVPEFIKESRYSDMYASTIRRDTNSKLFNRALHNFGNHSSFNNLWQSQQAGWEKNIDNQLLKEFKNHYKSLKESYESQSACCSILVPRQRSRLLFDGETAGFAITGGNDKCLRYWHLRGGKDMHYMINSPQDKESVYNYEENVGKDKT